jgi:hypothetical protein
MRSPLSRMFRRDLPGKTPRSKLFGSKSNPHASDVVSREETPSSQPLLNDLINLDFVLCTTTDGRWPSASGIVVNGDALNIFDRARVARAPVTTGFPNIKNGENLNKRMTSTGYRSRFASEAQLV